MVGVGISPSPIADKSIAMGGRGGTSKTNLKLISSKYMNMHEPGKLCPKCGLTMQRRKHGPNETVHLLKKYYYREWDVCRRCKYVQHYEEFKVFNKNKLESPLWI